MVQDDISGQPPDAVGYGFERNMQRPGDVALPVETPKIDMLLGVIIGIRAMGQVEVFLLK
ncbi:MAG: hypothetical protein B6D68_01270 [spirochete symbiont of Stewartia floridana]|nr:MAG: hypothetical protein B6D68_01270 [spirochete symbiont of Stewartia floridana]